MSNEIKKYDEYIFKDGEYRQVAGSQGAGRKTSKYITVSKRRQSFYYAPDDTDYYFQILRLTLVGFSNADVGRKIFLYKTKRRHSEYITHPRDCFEQRFTNIAQLGCGVFYNKDDEEYIYHHTYQTNQGLAQTEWTLTSQNIEDGYLEINISEWLVNLLFPREGYNWNDCRFIGGHNYWFALENDMKTISERITFCDPTLRGSQNSSRDGIYLGGNDNLLELNGKYYLIEDYFNYYDKQDWFLNRIGIRIYW